jgi:hypothetical protein
MIDGILFFVGVVVIAACLAAEQWRWVRSCRP